MIKIMMPDTAGSKNTRICSTYSNGRIVPDGAGARIVSLTLFRLQSPCSFNDNVTIIVAMQHEMPLNMGAAGAAHSTPPCGPFGGQRLVVNVKHVAAMDDSNDPTQNALRDLEAISLPRRKSNRCALRSLDRKQGRSRRCTLLSRRAEQLQER